MDGFAANSERSVMSPHQEPNRAPTSPVPPHPRHRSRSLHHDRWHITGTQYHHDYAFHLVDDDDPAAHHYDPATYDDDNGSEAGHRHSPGLTSSHILPTGDRGTDREALVPVRTGGRAVGDRDRLARVELPARRGEPHWLLLDLPDGAAIARSDVRSRRVSRLVLGAFQCGSKHPGRRIALCGLGILTLATLIAEVL